QAEGGPWAGGGHAQAEGGPWAGGGYPSAEGGSWAGEGHPSAGGPATGHGQAAPDGSAGGPRLVPVVPVVPLQPTRIDPYASYPRAFEEAYQSARTQEVPMVRIVDGNSGMPAEESFGWFHQQPSDEDGRPPAPS
ncbi:hypothetical protein GTW71_18640, partial [Streptomyces sp. SID6041]|nr:hypothetical protein [Streptomyces sp. SID6041]